METAAIQVARREDLVPAPATPGLERLVAFDTDRAILVRAKADAGVTSGWHHHGEREVFGFLLSGTARFEFGSGGNSSAEMKAGDFMHVPAGLIHRDVNPDDQREHEFLLVFAGEGPLVVNVDGPESAD